MYRKPHLKSTALLAILLVSTFFALKLTPIVSAEVSITELSKTEGFVGENISLTGQINTTNGAYEILFDGTPVKPTGNASLTTVEDTFVVPNSTKGTYEIALKDIQANITSEPVVFTVKTQFVVKTTRDYLQEGENASILAIVTGAEANLTLSANITVRDPDNRTYSCPNFNITTSSEGYGEMPKIFPEDFDIGSHTFYVGTYNLTLNVDLNKTSGSFIVGITDALEYHRFQVVNIKAANYTLPNDIMQIVITHNGTPVFTESDINASQFDGKAAANWTIPADASLGLYSVNVIRTMENGTEKPVPDYQNFTIVAKSYALEVKTVNLDNEPVERIVVEANNTLTSAVTTNITNKDGLAFFYLEATNYTLTAFLNNSQVSGTSEISLAGNLTGAQAININCSLAHIKATVKDAEANPLPFITIKANFTYTTRENITIYKTALTETNLSGVALLRNLFMNINYTVEASRYDQTFDATVMNLTSTLWFNTTCPKLELVITALDRNDEPLQDASVKVYDWGVGLSGLVETGKTDAHGKIALNLTFGKYMVHVYKEDLLLNQTIALLTVQPTHFTVYCKLYNLTLNISVVDYFGQGIPNTRIDIEREGSLLHSLNTGGNGVAQFSELVGGSYRILVYINEKPYKITTFNLQEPETVTLKLSGIVSIGWLVTETSLFATALLIILVIAAFLLAFTYRRIKLRHRME